MDECAQRIERILRMNEEVIEQHLTASRAIAHENPWLSVPLTMPQLKTLLFVNGTAGTGATVGSIARCIGVGLPTVSGILDRLYEQKLISRHEDVLDRRITRIVATEGGRSLIEKLYHASRVRWRKLLERLDAEELQLVEQAFDVLSRAARRNLHE